jgi:colanic acid/amylovoran biosynthesis glycosyltransferase
MRVAYILKIFPKLSETFIASELAELQRRGVELRILSLLPARDELRHALISNAGLDQITSYDSEQFSALLQEFGPELVHAHFATESTAVAREVAEAHRVPFTFTSHGYDIHRKPPPDFAERAAAAAAVVTVSRANAAYIEKTFGVPAAHIRVIPCGTDVQFFQPRNEPRPSEPAPLIVCVARHVVVKNLGVLIRSCGLLRDRGIAFRCMLVGDGPCRAELETLSAQLALSELVQFAGFATQEEVLHYWQSASLGVLTSDNEGMPVCLMEAAACGVPVVATCVGGIPELVIDGQTGLLTPPGDARALASALERLLVDSDLRKRFGAAARKRAEAKFSVVNQVDQLIELWSHILNGAKQ